MERGSMLPIQLHPGRVGNAGDELGGEFARYIRRIILALDAEH